MDMPRISKLATVTRLAAEQNESVDDVVSRLIERKQSVVKVARELGVAPNTVRYHLEHMGYTFDAETRRWSRPAVKAATP